MIKQFTIQNSRLPKQRQGTFSLLLAVCCLMPVFLISCSGAKEKIYKKSKILMDTLVTINVVSDSERAAETAIDNAFAEIDKLDKLLNFFNEKSELSLINKNAGISPVKVSPETFEVIKKSLEVSVKTKGAFDATIGPLGSLWDFSNNPVKPPPTASIKEKLKFVNYKWVLLDKAKSTVFLKKRGMLLDLGAIAKGYSADRVVDVLKTVGIKSGLISVAGDIKAFGLKPDGSKWLIGIKNPRPKNKDDEIIASVKITEAISTSGDYERYFIADNKRYHHILDPKTGYPAEGCQSVSIVTKDGVDTDAFSTGIFVLGPEKGMQLLKETGFDGVIRDSRGNIQVTPGLKDKIEFKRDN